MKKIIPILFSLSSLALLPVMAENQPAFPGAEGYGRYVTGGRGGAVYHVTTLEDGTQEGTFRWAINKSGARTIVFDVSGTIQLTSELSIVNGNVTVAGQSAPGDGICIAGYPFTVGGNNVILRFLRFRLGNENVANHEGDGLGGLDRSNVMVDHCSVSWSIDECCSFCGMENSTVQWCIVSQSLKNAGHVKGNHGYGGNWGGSGMSYHHNLVCHHDSRTPRLGPRYTTQLDERMDMRNNVIYNWGGNGCYGGEAQKINIVNNYYKPGPATRARGNNKVRYRIACVSVRTNDYIKTYPVYEPTLHVWGKYYVDGNTMSDNAEVTADNWTKGMYEQISSSDNDNTFTDVTRDTIRLTAPIEFYPTTTHTAAVAYEKVLNYAGASLSRDALDAVMVSDVRNDVATYKGASGTGIIDSQEDCKASGATSAWPELKSATAPTDTDADGMPDEWEKAHGLNPNDASDRNTVDASGYTMLEVYLNGLVEDIMNQCTADGELLGTAQDTSSSDVESGETTISAGTYNGESTEGSYTVWEFADGWKIKGTKGYAAGMSNTIKFSRNTNFYIEVPEGKEIKEIKLSGYSNDSSTFLDAYIYKLGNDTFSESQYAFPYSERGAVLVDRVITPASPLSGSVLFRVGQSQLCAIMTITYGTSTGIGTITVNNDINRKVNVYNVAGQCVKSGIAFGEISNSLPKGIYIVDGQKLIVK